MARQMKDSEVEWIGKVPEDWGIGRLQWCIEEINESNDPIISTDVLSLTIEKGVIPYAEKGNQGNKSKENYSEYKIAFPNTLVVNSMNVIIGAVGISQYMGCVSPVYYVFRERKENDLQYIYYLFTNTGFQKEMRKYANGILEIRLRISSTDLMKLNIPIPPYIEQQRISKYLDKRCAYIDSILEQTRTSIEEYKKLKQAIITQAVTKGVRGNRPMKDSGIEWIDKIPENWGECRIKNVIFPKEKPAYENDEIITCFRDGEVTLRKNRREDGFTVSFTENGYHGVDVGDLVIHGMDAFAGAIGCSDSRGKTTPVVHACHTAGNNRYFMYYLRAMAYGDILMDLSNGVRIRSSDYRNFAKLGAFRICVPPIDEQNEIVEYLDTNVSAIDQLISKKERFIEELVNYKKSLVYEYVTGKKEVPTDEPEVVVIDPILLKALLYAKTHELLGKNCRGRIQIQKMLYLIESMNDLNIGSQYVRQKFGPMDVDLDRIESFMIQKRWLETIQGSTTTYKKMDHYKEYRTEFSKYLAPYEAEIERIVHFFENMNTSQAERFATLMAVWNDFILDGNTNPSDEELIHEATTNWHPRKANYKYTTWQDTVNKMRANGIVPHGYGLHTIFPVT